MSRPRRRAMSGALGLVGLVLACPASGASQGSPGATSSGSIRISVSIPAPARISGLSDVEFDAAGATLAQDLCFSGAPHAYRVAASGSGPGGTFSLSNGDESAAYQVNWLSRAETGSIETLAGDAPVTVEAVANPSDCGRELGAGQLQIAIASADSQRLQAGAPYTGSLVLMLAPQ